MRRRILVVDDDAIVQELFTLFLRDAYDVGHAGTGAEALAKLGREAVDLIVLDQRLPDRTGLDVLTELRALRPHVPVIMVTGYGSEWICAAAFKLGVSDYLPKPLSAIDLVSAVGRVVSAGPAEGRSPWAVPGPMASPAPRDLSIQKAMGLIQQRYWDHLSLAQLAAQVGMSKYRLSHRFREVLGVTFRDYLLRVRIERAKALLAGGDLSITEVAQAVGFGDLPRFDKLFKRCTGMTPSAYRARVVDRNKN